MMAFRVLTATDLAWKFLNSAHSHCILKMKTRGYFSSRFVPMLYGIVAIFPKILFIQFSRALPFSFYLLRCAFLIRHLPQSISGGVLVPLIKNKGTPRVG
jgi:hypothetical protein